MQTGQVPANEDRQSPVTSGAHIISTPDPLCPTFSVSQPARLCAYPFVLARKTQHPSQVLAIGRLPWLTSRLPTDINPPGSCSCVFLYYHHFHLCYTPWLTLPACPQLLPLLQMSLLPFLTSLPRALQVLTAPESSVSIRLPPAFSKATLAQRLHSVLLKVHSPLPNHRSPPTTLRPLGRGHTFSLGNSPPSKIP